jgi:hypothetical protein
MQTTYNESCGEKSASVRKDRTSFYVCGDRERGVSLEIRTAGGDDCDSVGVSLGVCFTCDEWRELLCQLGRVDCYGDCCETYGMPFDFEEWCETKCDPEPEPECCEPDAGGTVIRMTVEDIRKQIKGLSASDVIEISE